MEAAGTAYGKPFVSKKSEWGYAITRNAVLADLVGTQEKMDRDKNR